IGLHVAQARDCEQSRRPDRWVPRHCGCARPQWLLSDERSVRCHTDAKAAPPDCRSAPTAHSASRRFNRLECARESRNLVQRSSRGKSQPSPDDAIEELELPMFQPFLCSWLIAIAVEPENTVEAFGLVLLPRAQLGPVPAREAVGIKC